MFYSECRSFHTSYSNLCAYAQSNGRVIDAMYFVQNKDYAKYVIALALEAEDDELKRCVERLMVLTDSIPEQSQKEMTVSIQTSEESEITAEDIYRAQVPHHYIGALR